MKVSLVPIQLGGRHLKFPVLCLLSIIRTFIEQVGVFNKNKRSGQDFILESKRSEMRLSLAVRVDMQLSGTTTQSKL